MPDEPKRYWCWGYVIEEVPEGERIRHKWYQFARDKERWLYQYMGVCAVVGDILIIEPFNDRSMNEDQATNIDKARLYLESLPKWTKTQYYAIRAKAPRAFIYMPEISHDLQDAVNAELKALNEQDITYYDSETGEEIPLGKPGNPRSAVPGKA